MIDFKWFDYLADYKIPESVSHIVNEIHGLLADDVECLSQTASMQLRKRIQAAALELGRTNQASPSSFSLDAEQSIQAKGVLLWSQLDKTIGTVVYDSFGSRYLKKFPKVKHFNRSSMEQLTLRLKNQYHLSDAQFSAIETEVEYLTSNLTIKNAINRFIVQQLENGMSHQTLFQLITGSKALENERIDVTMTNATLFFTFNFDAKGLDTKRHFALDEPDSLNVLFEKLQLFSDGERADFPAVGRWRSLNIEPLFLQSILEYVTEKESLSTSIEVLNHTLLTMCYLLPAKNAESFFVHDAYGHSWQESLCEFEHLYCFLNELPQPVSNAYFENHTEQALAENSLIASSNEESSLLNNYFECLSDYYSRQLSVAINAILAEFTADAMEFHLQQKLTNEGESIPTSSKLRWFSLFLDLSLSDTKKHIGNIEKAIKTEVQLLDTLGAKEQQSEFKVDSPWKRNSLIKSLGKNAEQSSEWVADLRKQFKQKISRLFESKNESDSLSHIQLCVFAQFLRLYAAIDKKAQVCTPSELQQLLLVLTSLFQSSPISMFWRLDQAAEAFIYCDIDD